VRDPDSIGENLLRCTASNVGRLGL
jgi:hypothetical protein